MIRALAFLATFLPASAQALCDGPSFLEMLSPDDYAATVATANQTPYGNGLFYRADRGTDSLHIVGTLHLPDPRMADLMALVSAPLATSDLVLVEATTEDLAAMQAHMANNPDLMALPSDQSLITELDAATWDAIAEAAQARGIPPFMAAKMQPWFLALSMSIPPCAMGAMASGEGGLDALVMEVAADQGIPVAPLEAWQDMFALLTLGTFEEQVATLRLSLIDADIQDAMIAALIDAYFEGQVALSWQLSYAVEAFAPPMPTGQFEALMTEAEQLLLTDRNHNWIPVIEAASAEHDAIFIAFGAAHLIGEDGVLSLLAQNGWTITKLH